MTNTSNIKKLEQKNYEFSSHTFISRNLPIIVATKVNN